MPDAACPFPGYGTPGQSRHKAAPTIYYGYSFLIPLRSLRALRESSPLPSITIKIFLCVLWLIPLCQGGQDGAGDGTRTRNLLITNQLLYQLSYAGLVPPRGLEPRTN